jgi:hypothetical protein
MLRQNMPGFDSLIGKSLVDIVRNNLGQKTADRIEQRLFEKHGINLTKAVEDFPKLHSALREFFGDGAEGIEKQFLQKMIAIEQVRKEDKDWITIEDRKLTKLILESIGDEDKKNILNDVLDKPKIISDILETCNIAQTSGYRKVNNLIQDGFLIVNGYQITHDGKRVNKYVSIFDNIRIQIEKNKVIVQVQLTKESINKSTTIQLLRGKEQLVKVD